MSDRQEYENPTKLVFQILIKTKFEIYSLITDAWSIYLASKVYYKFFVYGILYYHISRLCHYLKIMMNIY